MGVTTFGFTKVAVIDTRCYYNIRQSEETTLVECKGDSALAVELKILSRKPDYSGRAN